MRESGVPYGTAYHALYHSAKAHASETVLVHGASGGVGSAAVQIARSMGLKIFGTAGTPTGLELAKREGAHQVFDHRQAGYQEKILKATGNRGVDIILEMLANVNLAYDTKLLAKDGRVVVIGNRGEVTINARELMMRRASIRAFTLWDLQPPKRRTSTPDSLRGSKMARCAPSWARNCHSPRRPARIKRSLNLEPAARLCSSADKAVAKTRRGAAAITARSARSSCRMCSEVVARQNQDWLQNSSMPAD